MEGMFGLKVLGAVLYALSFTSCISTILPGTVKVKTLKLSAFFCLVFPYVLFLLKPTLASHLIFSVGCILILALVFNLRLFMCCYMTVISYFTVSLAMICTHVLAFAYVVPVNLTCIKTFPMEWDLSLMHLIFTVALIHIYQGFVRFNKGTRQKTKADTRILILINGVGLAGLLVVANIYLRFLAVYSLELVRIPKLMLVLIFGFAAMVVITGLILYLLNLTIVSRLHLHAVKEYAERDIQTGVLNRQTGLDTLALRIKEGKVKGKPLTICFVDINNLKQVNDKLGHKAGDRLIEVVSETIRSSLRNKDFVCRLGGDEFLITYCDCGISQAKSAWNRIYCHLMKQNENPDIGFAVSVSYGFSEYNVIESLSVMDFIEQADAAMYLHKSKYKQMKRNNGKDSESGPQNSLEALE